MPIYEYKCQDCAQIFEEWQSNFEEKQLPCPSCGGISKRLISNTSFQLKGTGWYVTDYAGKNPSGDSATKATEEGSNKEATDQKPSADKATKRDAVKKAACPHASPADTNKVASSAA